jgi:protein phosphatase
MKIVIISDVHGNLEALQALTETYDELWVLGDLVNYGPDPGAVTDFIKQRATLIVRGNHDHSIATGEDPRCSSAFQEMAVATRAFTDAVLSDAQKDYLRWLPLKANRTVGTVRFHLCHATPSDPLYLYCPGDSPLWQEEARKVEADVLLVGHTHLPFVLDLGGRLVANPGSLGQPKHGAPEASYAAWEDGKIGLHSFKYEVDETIRKVWAMPILYHVRQRLVEVLCSGGRVVPLAQPEASGSRPSLSLQKEP